MTSPLYLAAGTVLDAPPEVQIRAAAAAGFDGCGLRLDAGSTDAATVARLAKTAAREGVRILDVEVVRLTGRAPSAADRRLVEIGAELGAQWVLTVSQVEEIGDRLRGLEALTDVAGRNGLRVALEFMAFTAVTDLAAALQLWSLIGAPVGVLVDGLHLHRTGGTATQVATMPPGSLAYLQVCDVAGGPAPVGAVALADEARHHRMMPGTGVIDQAALVAALPEGTPVTVEVQNDDLAQRLTAAERARVAHAAATRFVSR
ncbi:sugar phosphate isomerase/epimerase family protein [Jatrophihabitans sp. YIM 134969]